MQQNRKSFLSPSGWLCLAFIGIGAVLLCIRARYGFDWTDEPYYSALTYRFILGDRPFVDAWEVHQLSALIALPFLRAYLLFTGGSTAGVILYFRYILIAIQLAIAVYGFFVLRRRYGDLPALLFSGLLLFYAHYGINSFSYNMMAPLFAVLSSLLLFDALDGGRAGVKLLFSGAAYALSVMAHPWFCISLPVWAAFLCILVGSKNSDVRACRDKLTASVGGRSYRFILYFLLGGLLVAALLAAYLLYRASPSELLAGIRGMLSDPDHEKTNVLKTLGSYINAVRVLFGPSSYLAAVLCLLGAVTHFVKDAARKAALRRYGTIACALLCALTALWTLLYDYPDYHKINLCAMNLALAVPGLYFFNGKKPDRSLLLFALGCALSLAVQMGSNTRIRASSGALLPASLGGILYLFTAGGALFTGSQAKVRFRRLCAAACALTVLLMAGLRLTATYREDPLPSLNTAMREGPAAGIVTTAQHAEQYGQLYRDVMQTAPPKGRILITNLMPVGYLMTSLSPATPSVFNMTLDAAWLAAYQASRPDNRPTYVFAVSPVYGMSNELSALGTGALTPEDGWQRRELPSGTAFIRVAD